MRGLRIVFGNRPRETTLDEPLVFCSCFANREYIIAALIVEDNRAESVDLTTGMW